MELGGSVLSSRQPCADADQGFTIFFWSLFNGVRDEAKLWILAGAKALGSLVGSTFWE